MVKIKAKLKIDQASLKQIILKKQNLIHHNIKAVLQNEAIPDLVDKVMEGLDGLIQRANMLPEDPTNPANWRAEFKDKLEEDFRNTFMVTGKHVTIKIGETSFLGYDPSGERNDSGDDSPLQWMVYYLEGLAGDWAFISPDTYKKFRGATYRPEWGRFSEGFMISREDFYAEGWNEVVPFESVRHPFSGFSPLDIFTEALNEWRIRPFIRKALDAAIQGKKL